MWQGRPHPTEGSLGNPPKQLPADSQRVRDRCGREGHTRPRGHSENPRSSCQQNSRQQRPDVVRKATPDRGGSRKPPMQLSADSQRVRDEMWQGRPHSTEGALGKPPKQLSVEFQTVETRCGKEGHTRPRGFSETPDAVVSRLPEGQRQMWQGRPHSTEGALGKPPKQLSVEFQTVETRCGKEGHTRPRGFSETPDAVVSRLPEGQRRDVVGKTTPDRGGPRKSPDGVDPNIKRTRKTQRDGHNSGVKI